MSLLCFLIFMLPILLIGRKHGYHVFRSTNFLMIIVGSIFGSAGWSNSITVQLVLLRILNPQLNPRILPESESANLLQPLSDGFGSSSDATVISRYRLIDMDPSLAHRALACGCVASVRCARKELWPETCIVAAFAAHQWTCLVAGVKFIMPSSGIRNRVPVRVFFNESVRNHPLTRFWEP